VGWFSNRYSMHNGDVVVVKMLADVHAAAAVVGV